MSQDLLSQDEITEGLRGLHADWQGSTENLHRSIQFADFMTAVQFIDRIAPRCEELNHHPDLPLRWRGVDVLTVRRSGGGVTGKDLQLAGIVDGVAAAPPLSPPS